MVGVPTVRPFVLRGLGTVAEVLEASVGSLGLTYFHSPWPSRRGRAASGEWSTRSFMLQTTRSSECSSCSLAYAYQLYSGC